MSHSLSGDSIHPVVSRMRQQREKTGFGGKETWLSGFGQVCPLCKPQFSQLVLDRVKRRGKQEGALLAGNKQSCGKEVWY